MTLGSLGHDYFNDQKNTVLTIANRVFGQIHFDKMTTKRATCFVKQGVWKQKKYYETCDSEFI